MKKAGRLKIEDREKRMGLLFRFIFDFRYVTWEQFCRFSQEKMSYRDPRRLEEFCIDHKYIRSLKDPELRSKAYYLVLKGKEFLREKGINEERYRFDKRQLGLNTFKHHNVLIEAYFLLNKYLDIKEWVNEWFLRIGRVKKEKLPDGLMVLDRIKVALEVESGYRRSNSWKTVVARYYYDVVKRARGKGVLIVVAKNNLYKGIQDRLFGIQSDFSNKAFLLATIEMLKEGKCFYQGRDTKLEEALEKLEAVKYING